MVRPAGAEARVLLAARDICGRSGSLTGPPNRVQPIWRSTVPADAEAFRPHSDDTAALTPLEQRLLRGRGCSELFALSLLDSPEGEVPSRGLVPSLPRQAAGCGAAAHQRRARATIAEVR